MLMLQPMMYGTGVPFTAHPSSPLMTRVPTTNEQDVMPVEQLRFTKHDIRPAFGAGEHCGKPLTDLVNDLVSGRVCSISSLPPLEVVWHDGAWRSLCNKRLWCLKAFMGLAGLSHLLVRVHYLKRVPFDWALKNTTRDDGWTVQVTADEETLDTSFHEKQTARRHFSSGTGSPRDGLSPFAHQTNTEVQPECMDSFAEKKRGIAQDLLTKTYKKAIQKITLHADSQPGTGMAHSDASTTSHEFSSPSRSSERMNGHNVKRSHSDGHFFNPVVRGLGPRREPVSAGQEGAGRQPGGCGVVEDWSPSERPRLLQGPPGLQPNDDCRHRQLLSNQSEYFERHSFESSGAAVMSNSSMSTRQFTPALDDQAQMPQWVAMPKSSSQQTSELLGAHPPPSPLRQTASTDTCASPSRTSPCNGAVTPISKLRTEVAAPVPFKQPPKAKVPGAAGCSNVLESKSPVKSPAASRSAHPPQRESLASDLPSSPPPPPPPKAPPRSTSLQEVSVSPGSDGSTELPHPLQCTPPAHDAEVFRAPPPPPKMPPPRPPLNAQVLGASESTADEEEEAQAEEDDVEGEQQEGGEERRRLKEWLEGVDNGAGAFACHLQAVQKRYKSLYNLLNSVVKEDESDSLSVLSKVDPDFWTEFGVKKLGQQLQWAKAIVDAHKEQANNGISNIVVSSLQHASPKTRCQPLPAGKTKQRHFEPGKSNGSPFAQKLAGQGSLHNVRQHLAPPSSPPPPPPSQSSGGPKIHAASKWKRPLDLSAEPVRSQIQSDSTTMSRHSDSSEVEHSYAREENEERRRSEKRVEQLGMTREHHTAKLREHNQKHHRLVLEESKQEDDDEVESCTGARNKQTSVQEKTLAHQSKKKHNSKKQQQSSKKNKAASKEKEPEVSNEHLQVDSGQAEELDDEDEVDEDEDEKHDDAPVGAGTPAVQEAATQESIREHRRERQRLKNERKKDKKKTILASRAEELKEMEEQIRQLNADSAEVPCALSPRPRQGDTEATAAYDNCNLKEDTSNKSSRKNLAAEAAACQLDNGRPLAHEKTQAVCCLCKSAVHSIGLAPMLGVCKRHLRDLQAEERKLQKIISTDKPSLASIDPEGLSADTPNFYKSNQTALSSKEELTQCMKYALKSSVPERMDSGQSSKFVELCVKLLQVRKESPAMSKMSTDWVTSLIRLVKWLSFMPHMSLAFVMTLCPDDQDDIKQTLVSFVQLIMRVWSPKVWTECDANSDVEVSLSKANWTTWALLRSLCKPPDVVVAFQFLKYYGNIWKMDAAGKIAVPLVLHLSMPKKSNQGCCSGIYKLSDTVVNGQPLWEHADGHRFLFWSSEGAWTVGGREEADAKFDTDTGYIKNQSQSPLQIADTGFNLLPHEVPGSWSRWQESQGSWTPEARIVCTATDMKLSLVKVQPAKAYFGTVEIERLCATWFVTEEQLEDFKAVPRNLSKPFKVGELDGVYMIFNPPGCTRSKVERKKGFCSFYVAIPHKGQYTLSLRVGETCMTLTHYFSGSDDRGYLNFCKLEPECIQGTLEMSVELLKVNGVPARAEEILEKLDEDEIEEEEG